MLEMHDSLALYSGLHDWRTEAHTLESQQPHARLWETLLIPCSFGRVYAETLQKATRQRLHKEN